jgi:predicted glycoside hydrolase/deacetylase ChbG (UPF0249 family)
MKFIISLSIILLSFSSISQQSLNAKLGYPEDAKLLIIHGDDLGVAHSKNEASILAMRVGMVNSASIMMPCPWVEEVAVYARENEQADLGLHLTLTNEWYDYNWGPVASKDKVPSLINENGFLHADCLVFGQNATVEEAEIELRAQIEKALRMGIQPTHFDTHMGCLVFSSPDMFEVYLKLGREYKVPVMVSRLFLQAASQAFLDKMTKEDIIVENVLSAGPADYDNGMEAFYTNVLNELDAGVHVLLLHLAFDNAEMQAITRGQEYWGSRWRQQDFDFFTSDKCKRLLEENNIQLVTWRDIGKAMFK